jgi:putative transposase
MAESSFPLTALSEPQRTQALERFAIIRPALEEGVTQAQVARPHQMAPSTVQRWIKRYREKGLAGLANKVARSDKGKSRSLPTEAIQLIEGLALQTPPRSAASIVRSPPLPKNRGGNYPVITASTTSSRILIPRL